MNNPTGIYASKGDTLYVMVGGDIKEGSYVYLGTFEGYNRPVGDTKTGTKLKKGLNIVPIKNNETNTFICYTVETFKDRKLTGLKLSSYDDLKSTLKVETSTVITTAWATRCTLPTKRGLGLLRKARQYARHHHSG